jgi:flagellar hook-basal body complex protein FliE
MKIDAFSPSIESIATTEQRTPIGGAGAAGGNFGDLIGEAIAAAADTQGVADSEAQKLARGEGNLHEAALALEKADISMRLMTKARNKIVEAYQEIMRTPV